MTFNFQAPSEIIFGSGKIDELVNIIKPISENIIIIKGASNRFDYIFETLKSSGIDYSIYCVKNEPLIEDVDRAVTLAKTNLSNLVLGIGGGSVIDVAKAVGIMLLNPGEVLDYLEVIGKGEKLTEPSIPTIIVPTTSGTGAEVTKNSVLKSIQHKRKVSMRSPEMIPKTVLIDPKLMLTLPSTTTTYTGMDALTQVIEPFISSLSNPFTDSLCRDAIPRAVEALVGLKEKPSDIKLREEMAYVSLMGGLALANAKLGAVHGFAGPIGGMFEIPHGLICAILLPNTIKVNIEAIESLGLEEDINKYNQLAKLISSDKNLTIRDLPKFLYDLNKKLEIPTLSHFGIKKSDLKEIVDLSKNSSSMKGNTVSLTETQMMNILESSL